MTEIDISTYAGRRPRNQSDKAAAYERATRMEQAVPTTGQVIGSYLEETFQGAGSLSQDIQAMNIRNSQEQGTAFSKPAISEDDWKQSGDFRDGLTYHPSMTAYESKILAERYDDRMNNQLIQDKASGLQTAAGMGVGFISGVVEPKNLVSGVAAALVTGGVGAAIPSVGRVIAVNSVKAAAGRGVVEGVVGAALTEPSNLSSAKQLQDDYTFADSMMNLALGSVLGAGLGAGGKALELRAAGKQKAIVEAYQAERHLAVKELDTALAQTVQGAPIDVASVKQLDNAEVSQRARQELPRIEEKIAATGVTKVTDAFPETKVRSVDGALQVVYHGTKNQFDQFEERGLTFFSSSPKVAATYVVGDGGNIRPSYIDMKNPLEIDAKNKSFNEIEFEGEVQFIDQIAMKINRERPEYDGVVFRNVKDDYLVGKNVADTFVPFEQKQIRSIFDAKPNDPRLIDADRLQVRKGQAESDARIQTDNAPIKKLQDDLAKPDNSTAYNPTDSLDIQKYLDDAGELEDQIRIEQELESMKEELADLKEAGLLNDEELSILEDLANIDEESAIFDNVLLNAKICLTRG